MNIYGVVATPNSIRGYCSPQVYAARHETCVEQEGGPPCLPHVSCFLDVFRKTCVEQEGGPPGCVNPASLLPLATGGEFTQSNTHILVHEGPLNVSRTPMSISHTAHSNRHNCQMSLVWNVGPKIFIIY